MTILTKINTIALVFALSLMVMSPAQAAIDMQINTTSELITGMDSTFNVTIDRYNPTTDLISVLVIADARLIDVSSAMFLGKSGWIQLHLYQSGSDVLARFVEEADATAADSKTIRLRVNFNNPNTYVVGFLLQNLDGVTVSSAAAPFTLSGRVLGITTEEVQSKTFTRYLSYGSRGADVSALQTKLTAEGFYSGPITGFYGRLTTEGVRRYQRAHGISPVGLVGPTTLVLLNK